MPFSPALRKLARSQSPFFHNLDEKLDERLSLLRAYHISGPAACRAEELQSPPEHRSEWEKYVQAAGQAPALQTRFCAALSMTVPMILPEIAALQPCGRVARPEIRHIQARHGGNFVRPVKIL
jgi:hypothetical protein